MKKFSMRRQGGSSSSVIKIYIDFTVRISDHILDPSSHVISHRCEQALIFKFGLQCDFFSVIYLPIINMFFKFFDLLSVHLNFFCEKNNRIGITIDTYSLCALDRVLIQLASVILWHISSSSNLLPVRCGASAACQAPSVLRSSCSPACCVTHC